MEVTIDKQDSKLTVKVTGRLDTLSSPELEKKLGSVLEGVTYVVMDLNELEYISSAGLRVLIGISKALGAQGEMKIINVNETVMDIFEVTGLDGILNIV